MKISQFVEEMTDQRIRLSIESWKILQHSLYVKVLKSQSIGVHNIISKLGVLSTATFHRPAVIIITNTAF